MTLILGPMLSKTISRGRCPTLPNRLTAVTDAANDVTNLDVMIVDTCSLVKKNDKIKLPTFNPFTVTEAKAANYFLNGWAKFVGNE